MTAVLNGFAGPVPDAKFMEAPALNNAIDVVFGNTATVLNRPAGATGIVIQVTVGTFMIVNNDQHAAFPSDPGSTTATTTLGTAAWPLKAGVTPYKLAASKQFTVLGSGASDKMYYFWF